MKPIWMECEGSRCHSHRIDDANGLCSMCGEVVGLGGDGMAVEHQRPDILTMIERGDFEESAPYPKAEEPQ